MTRLATLFTCSFRRLKEVRTVTVCAMLGAIAIVLGSLSIDLGPSVRIGFSGIPNELVHYLFGPAAGSLFAGHRQKGWERAAPDNGGQEKSGFQFLPEQEAVQLGLPEEWLQGEKA